MKIIAFITQKGGAGKTTLALNLAVAAMEAGKSVLIVDLDPQATARQWWEARTADKPDLVAIEPHQLEKIPEIAEAKGFDLVVIDTPGRDALSSGQAIQMADLCLLPCRPSLADIKAQNPTAQLIAENKAEAAFVRNCTRPTGERTDTLEVALNALGVPVSPCTIANRVGYSDAYAMGLGITEYEPEGKGAEEIRALWTWCNERKQQLEVA